MLTPNSFSAGDPANTLSLRPVEGDVPEGLAAKHLALAAGHYGGVVIPTEASYRGSEAAFWPPVPTAAVVLDAAGSLEGLIWSAGAEWRQPNGNILTTIALPAGTHFLSLLGFANTTSGNVLAYLAAPWHNNTD